MEEVDPNAHGWLWGVQDFSGRTDCSCGRNNKRTGMRTGTWRCDWTATISWLNFMDDGLLLMHEQKKSVS